MNVFFKGICQMGIFMICAQAIVHFRPDGSYEKYLKMLVSVMILVQVFLPVAGLFSSGMQQSMEERIAGMEKQIQESMAKAGEAAGTIDGMLDRMTLEEVRERVARQQEETEMQQETKTQQETKMQQETPNDMSEISSLAEENGAGEADVQNKAAGKTKQSQVGGSGLEEDTPAKTEIEIEKVRIGAGGRE